MESNQAELGGMKAVNHDFYVDKSKEIGRGNFGSVYKGYHMSCQKIIAVKFVDKKILAKFPDHNRQITVMEDLAKIQHPYIMGYYGHTNCPEGLYCFIEFCNGGNLKQLSKSGISEFRCVKLFEQLLDAMIYMNQRNKVHRDLKPDNILLDENDQLKIADFGLARDLEMKMTKGVCTPLYACPEVLKLEPYNEKCDVWSSGLILFEMLTGKEMFSHITKRNQLLKEVESFANPSKKIKIPENYNKQWEKVILKMMTYDVKVRPTFKELKVFFDEIKPTLEKELLAKYGEEKVNDDEDQLRLTKSINPYHSNRMNAKVGLAEMARKLQEQNSFTKLNNLRKWLQFSRQRAEIMLKLIKQFNKCQYPYIKNVHKYILMFLSTCMYVSRLKALLQDIIANKVKTPDGLVTNKDICNTHQPEYQELIKEIVNKFETSIEKYEGVLKKQIIVKIMSTYIKRDEQKKIINEFKDLTKFLEEAEKGKYHQEENYVQLYRQLSDAHGIKYNDSVLKDLKYEDLRVYTYIRIIGHLDDVFDSMSYRKEDYLRARKQNMENANKDELMTLIKTAN